MNLIIVESPTKARTLAKFLKGKFRIEATVGHIRDLPKSTLGVDVEHDFTPTYVIPKDKQKHVTELKKIARQAERVILATDPDREGEAIAWHVASILTDEGQKSKIKNQKSSIRLIRELPFQRIAFHEITESAIAEALEHPRGIDLELVDAQQARRILDRLVGYKLSPLLWQKLSRRWLSAGRVQSVAVRLLVEREREIQKFVIQNYWTIEGNFAIDTGNQAIRPDQKHTIRAELVSKDRVKYEKILTFDLFDGKYTTTASAINSEQSAESIIHDLHSPFTVTAVDKKELTRSPLPPYSTSTLQQDAGRKLFFSSKKIMQLAQKLYEEGYITYHRTDSVNLSEKFIDDARSYIAATYGKEYLPDKPRRYKTKSKVAQEAHEAIRPTRANVVSSQLHGADDFNRDHVRLYDLIWKRALASQAKEAVFYATVIMITSSNGYLFQTNGSVMKFDGFLKITGREIEEVIVPTVAVGDVLVLQAAGKTEHASQPPPQYTEATLVRTLEEKDIGRPSTYASIIGTVIDRQYVTKVDKKLIPTDLGFSVTDFLVRYFPDILNLPFTKMMEDDLDAIANGQKSWIPVIAEFYTPFVRDLEAAYTMAVKVHMPVETLDELCPTCKSALVIRSGRYGKFIACSSFPTCTYTRQILEIIDIKCPKCGGDMVAKKTKHGKSFYGCRTYPACTFAAWKKEDIK